MNDPIRVGVLGAGAIAQVAHLPVLRRLPGVEVAAICDNDVSKAQALASRFDVKDTYDDIEEVLRYANVDVVVICTPNHLHEIHATSALAAGVHVLCERPLALTLAGVERVLAASDKYGKRVMVGMNHRFRSDVQAVRGFLAGGDLGGLQAVRGGWYTFQPSRQMLGWRLRREQAGGGAVLDLGLPLIDLGMWLAGWPAPKRVSAHLMRAAKDAVEDMGSALIVCENGVSVTMDVSWRHLGEGERFWFDIVGSRGSAMIQPLRIFKEQHGAAVDLTPTGAVGRETQFTQSYPPRHMAVKAVLVILVKAGNLGEFALIHQIINDEARLISKRGEVGDAVVLGLSSTENTITLRGPTTASLGEHPTFSLAASGPGRRLIRCQVFSPDGSMLASAGHVDGAVRLWDVRAGKLRQEIKAHDAPTAVAFSPDGKTLATGGYDGTLKLWDVSGGAPKRSLNYAPSAIVSSIVFSHDGRLVACGGDGPDGELKVWDARTGELKMDLKAGVVVNSVAFSPDGKGLACATSDKAVKLWNVSRL